MTLYERAVTLGSLRGSPGWHDDGLMDDDAVVYVASNGIIRSGPWSDSEVLFGGAGAEGAPNGGVETPEGGEGWPRIRLHPLNRHFVWRRSTGPFRRLTQAQAEEYDANGFVVVPDCFDEPTIARVTSEIDHFEDKVQRSLGRLEGGTGFIARADEITFTTHIVRRSRLLREFCSGEVFCDLTFDLVGPDVRLYWDHAVYKKPHCEQPFPWHQDNGYTFVEPQQYLTCWIALTDADESNGCMWTLPGGHLLGTLAHEPTAIGHQCFSHAPPGTVPVRVRAGSMVVLSTVTPHQTGPNHTDGVRKAYILQYVPTDARTVTREADGRLVRKPADAPDRQFTIVAGGRRVVES